MSQKVRLAIQLLSEHSVIGELLAGGILASHISRQGPVANAEALIAEVHKRKTSSLTKL